MPLIVVQTFLMAGLQNCKVVSRLSNSEPCDEQADQLLTSIYQVVPFLDIIW